MKIKDLFEEMYRFQVLSVKKEALSNKKCVSSVKSQMCLKPKTRPPYCWLIVNEGLINTSLSARFDVTFY